MTKLLLIRHGQSQANVAGLFAGFTDAPLTDLGREQARRTADFIVKNYAVDAVWASDLRRAFDTGKAVADRLGLEVHPEPALREIYGGKWEGVPYDTLAREGGADYRLWLEDIGNSRATGGESAAELAERVYAACLRIARENPGKTVVVATHATPVRAVQWRLSGQPLSHMAQIPWVSNASVTELFYEDGVFRLGKIAQDDHLAELKTVLPKNV